MSEELKPCPFCGNDNVIDADYGQEYWCACSRCGCKTGKFGNRAAADDRWNTRAELAAPPAPADAVSVPVALMELEWLEGWLRFAAEPIGQECCGRGGQECCGCPDPVYPCLEDVGRAMDERAKELRALLAQSESKGVKS